MHPTLKVFFAADHAGFELKNTLLSFVRDELKYEVEDMSGKTYDMEDDYPKIVARAAQAVGAMPEHHRAIVIGASGQGEAIVANRFPHVRATVYYGYVGKQQTDASGKILDLISSLRAHNDSNVLSLGARFLNESEAKDAVRLWLVTPFSGEERHARRNAQIDHVRE